MLLRIIDNFVYGSATVGKKNIILEMLFSN